MGPRHWVILALWMVCAAALTLGYSRPARAAAPICDDRAASAVAPPPIAPMRDMSWEPDLGYPCAPWLAPMWAMVKPDRPSQVPSRPSQAADEEPLGASLGPAPNAVPQPPVCTPARDAPDADSLRPGHYRQVFRPPR